MKKTKRGQPDGFSAGIGLAHRSSPYKGVGEKSSFIPMISYKKGPFLIRGPFISYRILRAGSSSFSLGLVPGFFATGYEEKDSEFLRGMDEAKGTLEGNVTYSFRKRPLSLMASVNRDLIGVHHGMKSKLSLGTSLPLTIFLRMLFEQSDIVQSLPFILFSPSLILNYYDSKYAGHFYGVDPWEENSNRSEYKVGSLVTNGFNMMLRIHINDKWHFMTIYSREFFSAEITNSPIVSKESIYRLMGGVSYQFGDL